MLTYLFGVNEVTEKLTVKTIVTQSQRIQNFFIKFSEKPHGIEKILVLTGGGGRYVKTQMQ